MLFHHYHHHGNHHLPSGATGWPGTCFPIFLPGLPSWVSGSPPLHSYCLDLEISPSTAFKEILNSIPYFQIKIPIVFPPSREADQKNWTELAPETFGLSLWFLATCPSQQFTPTCQIFHSDHEIYPFFLIPTVGLTQQNLGCSWDHV